MMNLDKLYNPSEWSSRNLSPTEILQNFEQTCVKSFEEAKKHIPVSLDVDYGPQKLDIWGSNPSNATHIFVYFHGGYWQYGSKSHVGPLIDLVINGAGIPLISVGYDMATTKSFKEVVQQAKIALEFIQKQFQNAVFTVSGHSAGAFLAASAVSSLEDSRRIKQIILISGIYTLNEFSQTKEGKNIRLQDSDFEFNIDAGKLAENLYRRRITIFIAENETPKFHEQADSLQKSVIQAAKNAVECEKLLIKDDDHFSIIENMLIQNCDPARHLLRRLRFF